MTDKRGKVGYGGIEEKGKRTHGHRQQCDDCWEEGGIRGRNGNRKKYNKIITKTKLKNGHRI